MFGEDPPREQSCSHQDVLSPLGASRDLRCRHFVVKMSNSYQQITTKTPRKHHENTRLNRLIGDTAHPLCRQMPIFAGISVGISVGIKAD